MNDVDGPRRALRSGNLGAMLPDGSRVRCDGCGDTLILQVDENDADLTRFRSAAFSAEDGAAVLFDADGEASCPAAVSVEEDRGDWLIRLG